jgi:MoaA/NifB/PqqE/SkfB family radical SAM enzyme
MCDIWKRTKLDQIGPDQFDRQLPDIEKLGVEWVVFSGGEPLLHADLFRKAAELRRRNIRITLLSSGLLLSRYAERIVRHFDDVIVSLDGPRAVHDGIRGVPRAFELLAAGVDAIHAAAPGFPVSARCTVQRANSAHLSRTVAAARGMQLQSISFLAADVHSAAFNRQSVAETDGIETVTLDSEDLSVLHAQIEAVIASGSCGGYVTESAEKLRKIEHHFRCCLGLAEPVAPVCNAPWTSAVIEADGAVRPCFFHRAIGHLNGQATLRDILDGDDATAFRSGLDVATDPICRKCVCSLNWKRGDSPSGAQ